MPQSNINPKPITVRKASRDGGDYYIYLYFRSGVSEGQVEDMDDAKPMTYYAYEELQLRFPLPSLGVNVSVAADHSTCQDALKAQLLTVFSNSVSLRQALKDTVDRAQVVGREDELSPYKGTLPVDITKAWGL